MKCKYKGYEISVERERCLGGWDMLYYSIFSGDGFECVSGFEDSEEIVGEKVKELKELIDEEVKSHNPWGRG